MKEKLLTLGLFFMAISGYSQIINFPDSNFKNDLIHHSPSIDLNNDGEIDVSEAQNYSGLLSVGQTPFIHDLTGIEFFINIRQLVVARGLLTKLDLSNNTKLITVQVDGNKISTINLGNNPNLIVLTCSDNELVDLDISGYPSLQSVYCYDNPNLKTLDIANGNNHHPNFTLFAENNPKLICINIDRGFTPPTNWRWRKDASASYSDICIDATDSQVDIGFSVVGMPESIEKIGNDIIVYPNPANDFVTIRSEEKIEKLTLYTFTGENVVEKQNTNELDISEMKRGIYWLVIETKSKRIRKKVIKE
ncbi:hypothetical protein ATO12_15420 [Aquimarina atlantica]|uniref:Secretion system C-terminal sorting domain-containing protein n=1 Tax=Aquimarina atlantica TaxID=1317122 RepID=A0A023BWC7_9FLAO|nr:T9SS type A sorting domain-containing protein [Aquimarina atlantica]EZH74254.1 hypothetical protein ATO12_15420 [Aquimarina atlantica]